MSAPIIESIAWGRIVVLHNGEKKVFKDVKITPSSAQAWDWG